MKKGILYRLLVIVLVCTMLIGLMGFTTVQPLNDVNDVQNEDVTPEEPPVPDKPDETKPEMVNVTVKAPEGGTLECTDAPEDAKKAADGTVTFSVKNGAKINFVAAAATEDVVTSKFTGAYVYDGEKAVKVEEVAENDAGYTFAVSAEKDVTISAKFLGIKSVTVESADKWTESKTIEVKTIGDVESIEYAVMDAGTATKADGNIITIKDEIGEEAQTYRIIVKDSEGLKAETEVKVSKIDRTPPTVTDTSKTEKIISGKKWYDVTWKITETGSGVDPESFVFERINALGNKVDAVTAQESYKYSSAKELKFRILAGNYNNLIVTFKDNVGNPYEYRPQSEFMPYIEITDVTKGYFNEEDNCWWAGSDAELLFYSNVNTIEAKIGDVTLYTNQLGIDDKDEVYQYSAKITGSGKCVITATSNKKEAKKEAVINYDPDAPVITEASYISATNGDNWLKGIIHKISGGVLFNEAFDITFKTNNDIKDESIPHSGIDRYEYLAFKNVTEIDVNELPSTGWEEGTPDNNGNIPVRISDDFTGSIVLRVWDKAGNSSAVVVGFTEDDGSHTKGKLITNKATINDDERNENFNPSLTVMATSGGAAYEAVVNDKDNWVTDIDFEIYAYKDESRLPEDSETSTYKYTYEDPIITAEYDNIELKVTKDNNSSNEYAYLATIGKNRDDHVSCASEVTFTAQFNVDEVNKVDGSTKRADPVVVSLNVAVRVQNYIDSASVEINDVTVKNDFVSDWYNGNGKELSKVFISTPASKAPFTTTYSLTYQAVNSNDNDTITVDKAEITDPSKKSDILKNNKNNKNNFTKAGIYKLTVTTQDELGNTPPENSEPVITIYYDPYPATINVSFSQDKEYGKNDNEFFDILRKAEVIITDDTFTGDEDYSNFVKITQTAGADAKLGEWFFIEDENGFGGTWKNSDITYGVKSGETAKDGDNYKMTVNVTDPAGNESRTDEKGRYYVNDSSDPYDKDNHYTGHKADDFTIDQTKPVITVSFDNNNARHGNFFAAGRTATITVNEHNFSEKRVVMKAVNATSGGDGTTGWTRSKDNNDIWTKTVVFNPQDATCEFSIEIMDLAGNVCRDYEVNYGGSVAHDKFVIDQVNPDLSITGTNATPYADDCTPGFTGHDTNMSNEYTMTLTRTVRASRNENVSAKFLNPGSVTVTGTDINAVFNTLTKEAENDGIYVLTVSVTDMAGNSSQASSTFTVNRNGSFYIFNDGLSDLVNAKFVQKADGKYQVTECNASPLVVGSVKIEIYRDGQLTKTITPKIGAGSIGTSGLYEYVYDLPAENFAQDGRYKVVIVSEDDAENKSDNTKLDDGAIQFAVDSVAPEITLIKGLEKSIVNAESLEFTANVIDTYGIASIKIVVDGKVVKEYVTQETYDKLMQSGKTLDREYVVLTDTLDFTTAYTLSESKDRQNVEIIIADMAGNVTTTSAEDFAPAYDFNDSILVSTSFWARYIHNVWALVATGVVIVAAGTAWFIIAGKKKGEKEKISA